MTAHKFAFPDSLRPFWERHEILLLSGIFALGLLIRLPWLGADFNITADPPILRSWMVHLQEEGLAGFYGTVGERTYPPLSIYLLAGGAWLADMLSDPASPNESLLNALIKLPAILADMGTAALLVWQAARQTATWRIVTAALYLLNPAVWYVSVYWGQTDAVYVFFLVAALMLLARGAVAPAWLCYTLSLATKLQGLPLAILFVAWTLVHHGRRAFLQGLAAAAATTGLLLLPWLLNGRLLEVTKATLSSSSRVVQSAYNGWYFLLRDQAGIVEVTQKAGILPFSYQTVSLFLFLIVVLFVTILIVRRKEFVQKQLLRLAEVLPFQKDSTSTNSISSEPKEQLSLPLTAVVLILTAFLCLTDIRERYLFPVLPLHLWGAGSHRRLLWFYLILTATWLFNLVTIASFAPDLWTNLVAWQRPYPARIELLKGIAWVVSAVHLAIYLWLSAFMIGVKRLQKSVEAANKPLR